MKLRPGRGSRISSAAAAADWPAAQYYSAVADSTARQARAAVAERSSAARASEEELDLPARSAREDAPVLPQVESAEVHRAPPRSAPNLTQVESQAPTT